MNTSFETASPSEQSSKYSVHIPSLFMCKVVTILCGHGEQKSPLLSDGESVPNPLSLQGSAINRGKAARFAKEIFEIFYSDYAYTENTRLLCTARNEERIGGEVGIYRNAVASLARQYLDSHPGSNNAATNHDVHNQCNAVLGSSECLNHLSFEELEILEHTLRYRLGLIAQATEYLERCDVPLPRGCKCEDFDGFEYRQDGVLVTREKYQDLIFLNQEELFPDAFRILQRAQWAFKPKDYVQVAFYEAGYTRQEVQEKLEAMIQLKNNTIRGMVQGAAQSPGVRAKFAEYFQLFGKKIQE